MPCADWGWLTLTVSRSNMKDHGLTSVNEVPWGIYASAVRNKMSILFYDP